MSCAAPGPALALDATASGTWGTEASMTTQDAGADTGFSEGGGGDGHKGGGDRG